MNNSTIGRVRGEIYSTHTETNRYLELDQVWLDDGSVFVCLADTPETATPLTDSNYWRKIRNSLPEPIRQGPRVQGTISIVDINALNVADLIDGDLYRMTEAGEVSTGTGTAINVVPGELVGWNKDNDAFVSLGIMNEFNGALL